MNKSLDILKAQLVIAHDSKKPEYLQIADEIIKLVRNHQIIVGDKLPPVNKASVEFRVSKDTIIAAYRELQRRKIIDSTQGKGFYIIATRVSEKQKVMIFFDVMNSYREVLYRSISESLGEKFETDIYFHYNNVKVFKRIVQDNLYQYDHFIIMPDFKTDVSKVIKNIPVEKLLIIDKDIPGIRECKGVYQDFENDVRYGLQEATPLLKKYKVLYLVRNSRIRFIPEGIIKGFESFCRDNVLAYDIIDEVENHLLRPGEAFMVFTDKDLVTIIKKADGSYLEMGNDIGLISYDDTEIKEVLMGGITVMSTDFHQMGNTAARLIKNNEHHKFPNPFRLIVRKSL